ncbi:uncharacterized protein LOC109858840 [Pseudomyrmex gracilis]|uniref:uncharacterized protein LOC109858840 n=1 Tax=Pseudomyrmex gracilis TaxID=219809 RepID=UPI0009954922|nr:uncharacterized protein LOC109858840 [Pseudomyrmex gracilis]
MGRPFSSAQTSESQRCRKEKRAKFGRLPSGAAVFLTVEEGGSYAEALRKAAAAMDLKKFEVSGFWMKKAANRGMLLQVPGPGETEKASKALERVEGVRFTRPVKHAEVRVRDVVPPLIPKDIGAALAAAGGCQPGEIRTGLVRSSPTGYGTLWTRLPLRAARKVVEGKRIEVRWFSLPVEALEAQRKKYRQFLVMPSLPTPMLIEVDL